MKHALSQVIIEEKCVSVENTLYREWWIDSLTKHHNEACLSLYMYQSVLFLEKSKVVMSNYYVGLPLFIEINGGTSWSKIIKKKKKSHDPC